MPLTVKSNIDKVQNRLMNRIQGYRDPGPVRIVNDKPYMSWLEYGGIRMYTRKRRRPASRLGEYRLPKGGTSLRRPYQTVVQQPAYAIVRGAFHQIGVYGRNYFRTNKPPEGRKDLAQAAQALAGVSLRRFVARTPRGEVRKGRRSGKSAARSWRQA